MTMTSDETFKLILVDVDDNPIGSGDKHDIHVNPGQTHRAFSFFLFNSNGELFLQKRAQSKLLWPGYWSNSFCSHPNTGEELEHAVCRRADDELGIQLQDPRFLYRFSYQAQYKNIGYEDEVCSVYFAVSDAEPIANPSELSEGIYVSIEKISEFISTHPDEVTPWFVMEWQHIGHHYMDDIRTAINAG